MDEQNKAPNLGEAVMKGLLIGGSIGMIAGWFFLEPGRALVLGFICGLLAGVTFWRRERKRTRR